MSTTRARVTLACLVVLLIWGLLPSSKPVATRRPPPGAGDAALYMAVIKRLAHGERYYDALGQELRRDNYPTQSPFNWRTPLHLRLVAYATPVATFVLKLLVLAAVLATAAVLARSGTATVVLGTLAQMGALATAFRPDAVGVSEVWAGVLIALSSCGYYRARWIFGVVLGTLALFVRELAAPYCVTCAVLAIAGRRRRESTAWVAAGIAYMGYYMMHVWQVQAHQLPGDLAHVQSWQHWNGLQFTLATVATNGWLAFLPRSLGVVYMILALGGTVSPHIAPQARVALLTYVVLFAFAGLPFNYYWGFVTAPLWAFGVAHSIDGFTKLVTAAGIRRSTGGLSEAESRS